MNRTDIASYLLSKRNVHNMILAGKAKADLGYEAYGEALKSRWIMPNYETGEISITDNQSTLKEMRELVELLQQNPNYQVGSLVTAVEDGQPYSASVQKLNPDGSYTLSFSGPKKPLSSKSSYKSEEISPAAPTQPGQSGTPGTPGQPTAPGVTPPAPRPAYGIPQASRMVNASLNENYDPSEEGDAQPSRFNTVVLTAPTHWASYLINGDGSGMEDDETAEADAWIEHVGMGGPVDVSEESEFARRSDATNLAGEMSEYTFMREKGPEDELQAESTVGIVGDFAVLKPDLESGKHVYGISKDGKLGEPQYGPQDLQGCIDLIWARFGKMPVYKNDKIIAGYKYTDHDKRYNNVEPPDRDSPDGPWLDHDGPDIDSHGHYGDDY